MRLKQMLYLTEKNNESALLVTASDKLGELLETLTGNQQPSRQRRKVQRLPELAQSNLITGSS
ncbi:MAG: hypothetical protein OXE99_13085 [Cellvibrionales bacterium]|nr:hypothetical protein [Cellvibrionales bacterium]